MAQNSFLVQILEKDKEAFLKAVAPQFDLEENLSGDEQTYFLKKKSEPLLVLPRPDNTTTFPVVLKGLVMRVSQDGSSYFFSSGGKEILILSEKGWETKTPHLKPVAFPELKVAKKTRAQAYDALKAHSSGVFLSSQISDEKIAAGLLSILPTLKRDFEKDVGYINSTFSFPDYDYLSDLSLLGLQPVQVGKPEEDYFFLPRLTESKLRDIIKESGENQPEFVTKKGASTSIKNCFILTLFVVQKMIEKDFDKDIVVFVDLNSGNLGGQTSIYDCLAFLDDYPYKVQVTRVGSRVQAHFCLKFTKAKETNSDLSAYLRAAFDAMLVQTYRYLLCGLKLFSVTYELGEKNKRLVERIPLAFGGVSPYSQAQKQLKKQGPNALFSIEIDESDETAPEEKEEEEEDEQSDQEEEVAPVKKIAFRVEEEATPAPPKKLVPKKQEQPEPKGKEAVPKRQREKRGFA